VKIWWCLGSQYWAENPHVNNYSAYYGILLDMVGGRNATFYKEGGSMQFAPKVVKNVWNTARSLGYSNYFVNINSPGIMDDHIFVNRDAKIPMIDIVEYNPAIRHPTILVRLSSYQEEIIMSIIRQSNTAGSRGNRSIHHLQ
jgi:glutaminyl-peptide cyclotransferase